jgi:hypothetical protein
MRRLLLGVAVLALAAGVMWFVRSRNPDRATWRTRELATWGLARAVAAQYPGKSVLIVSNPFTRRPGATPEVRAQEEAGLRGLREGFGAATPATNVVFPELKPGALEHPGSIEIDAATTTPLSYLMAPEAFDNLSRAHPECEVIVSLVGLPADLEPVQVWRAPGPPSFALLLPDLRPVGDAAAILRAVKSGKLAAFVLPRPGAPAEQTALGRDRDREFERRFLLVTSNTVDRVFAEFPRLFGG